MFKKLMCWLALVGLLATLPVILILAWISGYLVAEDDPYSGGIEAVSKSKRLIPRIVMNWLQTYYAALRTITNGNFKTKYDEFF